MTTDDLDQVLNFLYECVPAFQSQENIATRVFSNRKSETVVELLDYLKVNRYVYQHLETVDDAATLPLAPEYSLTVRGIQFYQSAAVAKRPFFSREQGKQHPQYSRNAVEQKNVVDQLPMEGKRKSHSLLEQIVLFLSGKRLHHTT